VPGAVTQLRVFSVAGDYGDHTAWIWRNADTAQVGGPYTWNFGGVSGWVYFDIPPVNLDPATDYTVSISTGTGPMRDYANIAADVGAGGNNGLHLSYAPDAGVFLENDVNARPFKTWNSSSYLRDIIFVPATNTIKFPLMAVTGNSSPIPDGYSSPSADNHTDFGHGTMGGGAVERTFVITNVGAGALHLIGTPLVGIAGPQAGDFAVVAQPPASVAPGGAVSFKIRFSPAATGARKALVAIENDDKNPYYFAISGTGDVLFRMTSITTDLGAGNVTFQWSGPDQSFQVERAFSASGPFTPIGSPQTSKSYTDVGILQTNARTFYRVRY